MFLGHSVRIKYNIPFTRIFNADETGVLLAPDLLAKIIRIHGKSLHVCGAKN